MKVFCPSCDAVVETAAGAEPRCPQCHRALKSAPADEAPVRAGRGKLVGVVVVIGLVAAVAVGAWLWRDYGAQAPEPAAVAATPDLAGKLMGAGLQGDLAVPPGKPDAAMRQAVQAAADAKAVVALVQAHVQAGRLGEVVATRKRRDPVQNAAALWADLQAGSKRAVHPIEVAFLVRGLLEAKGLPGELVTDAARLQTPLLLTRTRLGVRLADGTVVEPLRGQPFAQPQPVAHEEAVAWWLVLRAQGQRMQAAFAKANQDLAAAEALRPGSPVVRFNRGLVELDQGMRDKGLASCETALGQRDDPLARLLLAELALAMEQPVKAAQRIEEVLKKWPDMPEALLAKAVVLLQRVPTAPEAQKAPLLTEAEGLLAKAVAAEPKAPGASTAKAQIALLRKDEAGAEKILREAAAQQDLDAAMMLAQVLRSTNRAEEAVQVLEAQGDRLDEDRYVLALLSALVGARQAQKALEVADKAVKLHPDHPHLALMRADLLRQNDRVPEAIAALEPLKSGPDGDRVALLQAQLLLQSQQVDKALPILEAAVQKQPTAREPVMLLVVAQAMSGQVDKADATARKAIADKVLKAVDVVGIYLQAGDAGAATRLLEESLPPKVPGPADPELAATLAMVHTASGKKAEAEALRDRLVQDAGDKGAELKTAMDQAIAGAEAELQKMQGEQGGGQP